MKLILAIFAFASLADDASASIFVRISPRLQSIQTTNPAEIENPKNLVYLDISVDKEFSLSGSQRLVVMLSTELYAGNEIPILVAGPRITHTNYPEFCKSGVNCQSAAADGRFYSAITESRRTIRIGFSLAQLCSTPNSTGTLCGGQGGAAYASFDRESLLQYLAVSVAVVPDSSQSHAKILLPSDPSQPRAQRETRLITLLLSESGIGVRD